MGLGLAILALVGCGAPQASPANRHLISSLRTALSAENPTWLAQNEQAIEQRRAGGQMGEEEYATFRAIVDRAQAGQWDEAEVDVMRFQEAQRTER
jgi:hypothetical protein